MSASSVFEKRQQEFARALAEHDFAGAVIMERRDLFYLTGTSQPCNLVICPGHDAVLFARRVFDWVRSEASAPKVERGGGLSDVATHLRSIGIRSGRLGFELDVLPARLYRKADHVLTGFHIDDCSPLLLRQRAIKDVDEIEALRAAAKLFEPVHETTLDVVRPGITEVELSGEISRVLRHGGHDGLVFYRRWDAYLQPEGIVASTGTASRISGHAMTVTGVGLGPSLPWGASNRTIQQGDVVVVDMGLNRAGYHADMSRSYVVGEADDQTRARFDFLLRCQDAVLRVLTPGTPATDIYTAAQRVADEADVAREFQGFAAEKGLYIGHGVGLELDEPPVLAAGVPTKLEAGMVVTIEPKLIGPWGAVQTEDTVLVSSDGPKILGTIPRELFEIPI